MAHKSGILNLGMRQSRLLVPTAGAGLHAAAHWQLTPLELEEQVQFEVREIAFRLMDGLDADHRESEEANGGWVRVSETTDSVVDGLVSRPTWTNLNDRRLAGEAIGTDLLRVANNRSSFRPGTTGQEMGKNYRRYISESRIEWARVGVTDADVFALAGVLKGNRVVLEIDLRGNPAITRASLAALRDVLPESLVSSCWIGPGMFGLECDEYGYVTGAADVQLLDNINDRCVENSNRRLLWEFEERLQRVRDNDPETDDLDLSALCIDELLEPGHIVAAGAALSGNSYVTRVSINCSVDSGVHFITQEYDDAFRRLSDGIRASAVREIFLGAVGINSMLRAEMYDTCFTNSVEAVCDASCGTLVIGDVGNDSELLQSLPSVLGRNRHLLRLNACEFSGLRHLAQLTLRI